MFRVLGKIHRQVLLLTIFFLLAQGLIMEFRGKEEDSGRRHERAQFEQTNRFGIESRVSFRRGDRIRRSRPTFGLCGSRNACTGNRTVFESINKFNCYCDNACFGIFGDCCPDYEKHCGNQSKATAGKFTPKFPSVWTCVKLGLKFEGSCSLAGPTGVWMIQTCPSTWPSDETRMKCQNPRERFSYPVEDYLPVVAENQFTYRNKHCAVCHGEQNYTSWGIRLKTFVTPPTEYDLETQLRFVLKNGGSFNHIEPQANQARRYCAGEKYKTTCDGLPPFLIPPSVKRECLNGPVEVVKSLFGFYYKNKACANCSGVTEFDDRRFLVSCAGGAPPEGFSIVFKLGSRGAAPTTRVVSKYCPVGTVYDDTLEFCRKAFITSVEDNLSNKFLVILWFEMFSVARITSELERHFQSALEETFRLLPDQISAINFHQQTRRNDHVVASFRLTLTPYQDLILVGQHNATNFMNTSKASRGFLKLLNFTGNFTFRFEKYRFPVIKLVAKQLACLGGRTLKDGEYQLDKMAGRLFDKQTGRYFSLKDYTFLEGNGGNITLCRQLVLSGCTGGAYVPLHRDEFVILQNWSLYHNATRRTFEFGDYQIAEDPVGVGNITTPDISDTRIRQRNRSICFPANTCIFSVCLPYGRTFNHTETQNRPFGSSFSIRILTLICFGISIIWLLLLIITYGIFQELRTLPGLNLLNLSIPLLISYIIWIIGTTRSQRTTLCTVFAVLEHYILLVAFLAMSVISYHSCLVFSQSFSLPRPNDKNRTFMKYSAVVWLCPAIFIVVCVNLDRHDVFAVNYGLLSCWLGTPKARIYLFLLPLALLFLFNVFTFVLTAVSLSQRHQKQLIVLRKSGKQNLVACAKLSTLVGFPWIFAFLGVLFPDVVAFDYLFVVCVCLQGFYIGVAFLCNQRTLKLYRNLWNKKRRGFDATSVDRNNTKPSTFHLS